MVAAQAKPRGWFWRFRADRSGRLLPDPDDCVDDGVIDDDDGNNNNDADDDDDSLLTS